MQYHNFRMRFVASIIKLFKKNFMSYYVLYQKKFLKLKIRKILAYVFP